MNYFQTLKPRLPKRYLLFIAAFVWTFAGGMLLFKGIAFYVNDPMYLWLRILVSLVCGSLFYILMFSKISAKHTKRIMNLKIEKPCMFSFFNFKAYIMMAIMISGGILLRRSGIVPPFYLSILYTTMGIPLFLSSLRFFNYGFNYRKYS
ncbi:MAG: hypothetical protein WCR42_14330 [bacterium]